MHITDIAPKLGKVVKDKVTGFKGVATAVVFYQTKCHQYGVLPQELSDKGTFPDSIYIDDNRLEVIGDGPELEKSATEKNNPGGAVSRGLPRHT